MVLFRGFRVRRLSKGPALAYWRLLVEWEAIFWEDSFNINAEPWRIAYIPKGVIFGGQPF